MKKAEHAVHPGNQAERSGLLEDKGTPGTVTHEEVKFKEVREMKESQDKLKVLLTRSRKKVGLIANTEFDESVFQPITIGGMDFVCVFCGARDFKGESTRGEGFMSCCRKGKVVLDDLSPYPYRLKRLVLDGSKKSKEYVGDIRFFNSALATASFDAQLVKIPSRGPQVIRIIGQIYHNTYALNAKENEQPRFGQLYVIDNEITNQHRLSKKKVTKYTAEILQELRYLIRYINPYAAAYKMMHEVERKELQ